jgi:hypothetical protein
MLEEVGDIAMDQLNTSTMILPHIRMMATRFLDTASPDSKGISIAFVRSNRCVFLSRVSVILVFADCFFVIFVLGFL